MKNRFLLLCFLAIQTLHGQTWQFIPGNDTIYFNSQGLTSFQNVVISQAFVVSDYTIGVLKQMDSSGILIQDLHRTWIPCNHCSDDSVGEHLIGDQISWLGLKVYSHPDGWVMGGKPGMEWTVNIYAEPGDKWEYMAGDSMELSSIKLKNFFGVDDSVKSFISDKGDRIEIGKSHGLVAFHFQSEHDFTYRYIGSQKLKDYCYTPGFEEFYHLNDSDWICTSDGSSESFLGFVSISNSYIMKPLSIIRYPDSILTQFRVYEHSITLPINGGNPDKRKESKAYYKIEHKYFKAIYDSLVSPFTKPGASRENISYYHSFQNTEPNSAQYYLPCYSPQFAKPGFFNFGDPREPNPIDSAGNDLIPIPLSSSPFFFEYFISYFDGEHDFIRFNGFEFSGRSSVCGFFTQDSLPIDTTNYFPVGIESHQSIALYPNPFVDQLNLENFQNYENWQLFDIHGKLVLQGVIHTQTIELNGLIPGVYIIQINSYNGPFQRARVIKME